MPYFPTDNKSPDHQESINVEIRGELYFFLFQSIRDVLRFSYEIGKKLFRIFADFSWIRPECRIHDDVQEPINKFKNRSRIR